MKPGKGFTLIELLVVIAIIAILAAILFPVFLKAKESSNRTKCLGNCRQIGVALQVYLDDSNGRYPCCYYAASEPAPGYEAYRYTFWMMMLRTYVKSRSIYRCPASADKWCITYSPDEYKKYFDGANYGINEYLVHEAAAAHQGKSFTKQSSLPRPSKTLLISDCAVIMVMDWDGAIWRIKWADKGGKAIRHTMTQIVYADCHAGTMKFDEISYKGPTTPPWISGPNREIPIECPIIHPLALSPAN